MKTQRAGIAFGSNLGERLVNFCTARNRLIALAGISAPILSSSIFETEPVDCEPGAPAFYNAVIEVGYSGTAHALLTSIREIERALGRDDDHPRNESRAIDLDLLYVEGMSSDEGDLRLPHPRMHLRRFVLEPLAEIRSDLLLPNQTVSVGELLAKLQDPAAVSRVLEKW